MFWLSNLAWDMLLYLSSAFIMYALILTLDDKETFLLHDGWGAFALIIILFGVFGIPFSYAFSFLFNNAASGFAFLIIVNILAGCIAPTAVFLLRDFGNQFDSSTLTDVANVLQWIFYWLPIFPYTRALMAIITVKINKSSSSLNASVLRPKCSTEQSVLCLRKESHFKGLFLSWRKINERPISLSRPCPRVCWSHVVYYSQ